MDWIVLTNLLIILISYLPQGDSGPGLIDVENGQSFQYFGCYYDSKNIKSFSIGDYTQVPDPIGSCAKAVQADGHRMFFLKNGGHCLSVQGKVEQFFQVKKSSRCVNGLGGNGLLDVYVFSNVTVSCPVGIRRFLNPYCLRLMKKEINDSKRAYQLVPTFLDLFPGLNATSGQLVKIYQKEPINARWMGIYTAITPRNYLIATKFLNKTNGKEFETVDDYKAVLKFMIESQYSVIPKEQHKYFQLYFMQPDKPFGRLTRLCNWREDRIFTDQRFAGINPMSIQRISGSKAGVRWSSLQTKLSDTFNWEAATVDALGMQTTLAEAINRGHVFVLHYPVLDGIPSRNETPSTVKNRKLMSAVSPIAVFVSKPSRDKNQSNEIIPVAIQMGHTKDSPVFTPKDGDQWLLAKQTVQVADFVYAGSVEHLLKTHLLIEPICVAVRRHFHKLHPLRQILQFHCRGVLGTNRFFIKTLTGIHGTSDRLFGVGYNGGYAIMKRAFKDLTWDDVDFPANIKKRGLDDKSKVPYFPYRDDGELIHTSIKNMLNEYVKLYYKHTCHVRFDPELQNFANEVSFEGKFKPDGGHGMIKGFPPSIKTRHELVNVLTGIIWTVSAQHSAMNYPSNYYGSYTPNMPTKLYNDGRVKKRQFDIYNLPGKTTATIQAALGMNLASFRYDRLFDYGNELKDKRATKIVNKHSGWMNGFVATVIAARNRKRDEANHLPYPYLGPGWIANSIHT